MKARIYLTVLGAALLAVLTGCNKAPEAEQITQEPAAETPAVVETPAPAQAKEEPKIAAAEPAPAPAPEPAKTVELAPEGVWYLRDAASVETDAGIVGLRRGSQVKSLAGGKYKTPAGDEVTLAAAQLTNNMEEVRSIQSGEQASEAQLAAWKQQQANAAAAQRQAAITAATPTAPAPVAATPRAAERMAARRLAQNATPAPSTGLSTGGVGATHSQKDYSKSYNKKQERNLERGFR